MIMSRVWEWIVRGKREREKAHLHLLEYAEFLKNNRDLLPMIAVNSITAEPMAVGSITAEPYAKEK